MRTIVSSSYVLIITMCVACSSPAPEAQRVDAAAATPADTELRDYQLRALEARMQSMPDGPERDYVSGMLAARSGRFGDAIVQLNGALPELRHSAPRRAAIALEAVATSYRAINQYGDAARAYAELSGRFPNQLNRFPADDAALARILSGTPPQKITWHGPVRLKTSKSPIGARVADLVVNGVRGPWMLDTGANQSVVSRTFAERLGVMPLPGVASVGSGLTGRQSALRAAVLPTMHVGGAELTNVVLLVLDDENLRFGSGADAYQMDAILGYPILKALGAVTFKGDEFLAGETAERGEQAVRMYMRGLTPAIECDVEGRPLLFTFDSGANSSDLSVRYYELFRAHADSWKTQLVESAGAGGSTKHDVYIQPRLVMNVGTSTITLRDVSIAPVRMNAALDILFGNLGQDFVDRFESVGLDFPAMSFRLGAPRADP
jgi:predicted aspartyl protease